MVINKVTARSNSTCTQNGVICYHLISENIGTRGRQFQSVSSLIGVELFRDSGRMRRGAYAVVVGKPAGNRPLVKSAYRWKNNIKMDSKK